MVKQVRALWSGEAGAPYYSNFYFDDDADAAVACATVGTALSLLSEQQTTAVSWRVDAQVVTYNTATGEATSSETGAGSNGSGEIGAAALPTQVQGLVSFTTGTYRDGRQVRGRFYCPGPTTAAQIAGSYNVNPAFVTAMQTFGDTLIDSEPDTNFVIWSRPRAASPGVTARAGAAFPVINADASNQWATQRSRGVRG